MAELETIFKIMGIPGVLLWLGYRLSDKIIPIYREYLKDNQSNQKSIATSLAEMVKFQRTIDVRLTRIEHDTDETKDYIRVLYEVLGRPLPVRPSKQRTVGSDETLTP